MTKSTKTGKKDFVEQKLNKFYSTKFTFSNLYNLFDVSTIFKVEFRSKKPTKNTKTGKKNALWNKRYFSVKHYYLTNVLSTTVDGNHSAYKKNKHENWKEGFKKIRSSRTLHIRKPFFQDIVQMIIFHSSSSFCTHWNCFLLQKRSAATITLFFVSICTDFHPQFCIHHQEEKHILMSVKKEVWRFKRYLTGG